MSLATRESYDLSRNPDIRTSTDDGTIVHTCVQTLDVFLHGLRPGMMTLIDSSDPLMLDLTNILCVNAVWMLGRDVVWIDGGTS